MAIVRTLEGIFFLNCFQQCVSVHRPRRSTCEQGTHRFPLLAYEKAISMNARLFPESDVNRSRNSALVVSFFWACSASNRLSFVLWWVNREVVAKIKTFRFIISHVPWFPVRGRHERPRSTGSSVSLQTFAGHRDLIVGLAHADGNSHQARLGRAQNFV